MTNLIIAASLQQNPDKVHAHIDEIEAEKLLSNKVHQTKGNNNVNLTLYYCCEYVF